MDRYSRFLSHSIRLLSLYVISVLLFMVFRTLLMLSFGNMNDIIAQITWLPKAYWVGLRYDTTVMAFILLPVLLSNYFMVFVNDESGKIEKAYRKFLKIYSLVFICFIFWILIMDFFFFKFFQDHINALFFGIADDDTVAVLESVWKEYPVITLVIVFLVFLYLAFKMIDRIILSQSNFNLDKKVVVTLAAIIIPFYVLCLRGSTGTFPITTDDTNISPNTFINSLSMNGVFAFKEALSQRQRQTIHTDVPKMLNAYGFTSPEEAINLYKGIENSGTNDLSTILYNKTGVNEFLEKNPPNVIFIQMESMSNYYLNFHSDKFNLLGQLENELPNTYLFRNFLSCTNGTIHTLEGLMVNSPQTPLSQSSYLSHSYKSSVALTFKNAGYSTNFITGAKLGWRNLDKFVHKQYFDKVEGDVNLLSKVDKAEQCEWGVFDEYMFERIYQVIENSKGKPQFVFAMSTTNHTPYELPSTYKPFSLVMPKEVEGKLRCDRSIAVKNFTNYQYANHCLGLFLNKLRNSPMGKNTIVVASGDHNTLQTFDYSDELFFYKRSVPCVFYIPDQYKNNLNVDLTKFASHKDIFPTIFNLSLSGKEYLQSGNNLFSDDDSIHYFSVNDYVTAMDQYGCIINTNPVLYFKWKSKNERILQPTNVDETPQLNRLRDKLRAYTASMNYFIQTDLRKAGYE